MQTKYIFTCESTINGLEVVNAASTNAFTLDEIVDQFSLFLRGCGFSFHDIVVQTDPIEDPIKP